mgnify:CR=1 FL=1
MLAKPKYLFLLFAFFLVEGAQWQYSKRFPSVAVEATVPGAITPTANTLWFNDAFARILGGVLVYFLIHKLDAYLFMIIFSFCSLLGHFFCFAVLTLNVDGTFFFASVGFWMALGSGAFWVLTAQIIMDEGGI